MALLYHLINPRSLYAIHANWEDVPVEHQDIYSKKTIDKFIKENHPNKEWSLNCLAKFPKGLRDTLIADGTYTTLSGVNTKLIKNYFDVKPTTRSFSFRYTSDDVVMSDSLHEDILVDLKKYLETKTKNELVVETVVPAFDISSFEFDEAKYFRSNDELRDEYQVQKKEFEETISQIINPNAFMRKCKYGDHLITKNELFDIYAHDKDFIKQWISDPERLKYEKMDFLPGIECPDDILNTFKGFQVPEKTQGTIQPFLELLEILGNHRHDVVEYITQWTAHMFQKPGEMPRVGVVFKGEQGIGKNSYTELLKRLLGDSLYFETSDPMNDLFGRFSTFKENKLCLVLNESDPKQTFPNNQKIKDLITNTSMNIESKGIKAYSIRSFLRLIFLSNNDVPVKIERGDRRLMVAHVSDEKKGDEEYWKAYYEWLEKPENIRAVFDYLMKVKLTLSLEHQRSLTDEYFDIQEACLPVEIKWLVSLIVEDFPEVWVDKTIKNYDLYQSYKQSLPSRFESEIRQFGKIMKKLAVPGFDSTRGEHGIKYTIDRQKAFEWLKAKKYTRETELQVPIKMEFSDDH